MSDRFLSWIVGCLTAVFLILLLLDAAITAYTVPQALYPIVGGVVGMAVREKLNRKDRP